MRRISVAQLPVDPGPAAWNRLLQPPRAPTPLVGDQQADWIVIGAGFAGLAAARRLTQICPTDKVAVLEACRVAEGPAGRNSGFMIDLPHDLTSDDYGGAVAADVALTADNRAAITFAADMAKEFGLGGGVFDPCGKINGAATDKGVRHNHDYAVHLAAMNEPFKMLDAAEMHALTGTAFYRSGLYTAGTAVIQPAAFVRGVADGLSSGNVDIFENSPVTSLTRDTHWVAQTPGGKVSAPKVILAVNGHLNSFGFMKRRLMHVFTYASMTRPLNANEITRLGGEEVWGLTPADPLGTTVRRFSSDQGDRIVIRNRFTFDPSMQVDQRRIDQVAIDHDRAFKARFPMLADVMMEYRWGGRLCLSRNNVSVVAEVDTDLFTACCQNGLGTARGTLSGMLAAELATGTQSRMLDRALAAPPPKLVPPNFVSSVGANMFLKLQERRAGREL